MSKPALSCWQVFLCFYERLAVHGLLSKIDDGGIRSVCHKDFVTSTSNMQKQTMFLGPATLLKAAGCCITLLCSPCIREAEPVMRKKRVDVLTAAMSAMLLFASASDHCMHPQIACWQHLLLTVEHMTQGKGKATSGM